MKKKGDPKGFNCKNPKCKKWHDFGVYVFGHWNEKLVHTCDACGQKHSIDAGRVTKL